MSDSDTSLPAILSFSAEHIAQAAALLEQGGLIGMPTETVYGLAADASSAAAVATIYAAKGRPSNHPVIVHIAPDADPLRWFSNVSPEAEALMAAFWPGPLTIIGPKARSVLPAISGGQQTVGVRCPSHPVAIALLKAFQQGRGGLAAPSANRFGRISPTTADHVRDEFAGICLPSLAQLALPVILDGGACEIGIESTIVDMSRMDTAGPVILRPGIISAQQIATCLQRPVAGVATHHPATGHSSKQVTQPGIPRVSGALDSHYAPSIPLYVLEPHQLAPLLSYLTASITKASPQVNRANVVILSRPSDRISVDAYPNIKKIMLPDAVEGYARQLYAALRQADQSQAQHIVITALPDDPVWDGIHDRVGRAAFGSLGLKKKLLQQAGVI